MFPAYTNCMVLMETKCVDYLSLVFNNQDNYHDCNLFNLKMIKKTNTCELSILSLGTIIGTFKCPVCLLSK